MTTSEDMTPQVRFDSAVIICRQEFEIINSDVKISRLQVVCDSICIRSWLEGYGRVRRERSVVLSFLKQELRHHVQRT
jgi:hypothetical protein